MNKYLPLAGKPINHWEPSDILKGRSPKELYDEMTETEQKFVDGVMEKLYIFDYYMTCPTKNPFKGKL